MYTARAASLATAADILEKLAADEHDNVRDAAVAGLRAARGHEADDIFLAALGRSDYQLVITAAQALEGTPRRADAAEALLTRSTASRRRNVKPHGTPAKRSSTASKKLAAPRLPLVSSPV